MNDASIYDEDYFLYGKESGKSLYEDYRWLPDLTIPMVEKITNHCNINKGARILDFGCARGYTVKALRGLGYDAYGMDVSEWAIKNADEETKPYLNFTTNSPPILSQEFDWVIAKDVLEHIHYVEYTIKALTNSAKKGVFVVVPLIQYRGCKYVIRDYEKDVTHCQRLTIMQWAAMFIVPGWTVEMSYRIPGIKDNYYKQGWELGNGFITCRRIEETN